MNLTLTADWPLEPGAEDWLRHDYLPQQFNIAAEAVRRVYSVPGWSPWEIFAGKLHVALYYNQAPDHTAGQYISLAGPDVWGFWNQSADCRVNLNWNIEYNLGHRVLQHEFRHMIAHMASGSGNFGHGDVADPYIHLLKGYIDAVYHTNVDNLLPDVRLRHVSNLNIDL